MKHLDSIDLTGRQPSSDDSTPSLENFDPEDHIGAIERAATANGSGTFEALTRGMGR